MPGLSGNSESSGYYNASGIATPQQKLPQEFVPTARTSNAINASVALAPDWNGNVKKQPIVQRAERTVGMKYLYVHGAHKMPVRREGADGVPRPWITGFQKNLIGIIHNAGFNNALFQAGYPGFNLGLSFKTPQLEKQTTGPGYAAIMSKGPKSEKGGSRTLTRFGRGLGRGQQ